MDNPTYYNFSEEFSKNPGLRFRHLSDDSGEEFREDVLEKFFIEKTKIIINVNDIESSLGSSFLSESFGNLAVKYGKELFDELVSFDTSTPKGKKNYEEMLERVKEALERHNRKKK